MTWLLLLLAVALLGAGAVVAAGRFEGAGRMAPRDDERRDVLPPPERPLRPEDLDDVRFATAVRGYRTDEVDALLARLRAEWAERESR